MNRITSFGPRDNDLPRLSCLSPGTRQAAYKMAARMAQEAKNKGLEERYLIEVDGEAPYAGSRDVILVMDYLLKP